MRRAPNYKPNGGAANQATGRLDDAIESGRCGRFMMRGGEGRSQ